LPGARYPYSIPTAYEPPFCECSAARHSSTELQEMAVMNDVNGDDSDGGASRVCVVQVAPPSVVA